MTDLGVDIEVHEDPAFPIYWTANATSKLVLGFSAIIYGFNVHETSGSATCIVKILDGPDTGGMTVAVIQLAQATSVNAGLDSRGIICKNGVTVNVTSGQAEGVIYYRHHRR